MYVLTRLHNSGARDCISICAWVCVIEVEQKYRG